MKSEKPMKTVKLKLNKQEARLLAENLSDLIKIVPERANFDQGNAGDWYYAIDRCLAGLVATIWDKYYTKLLRCEPSKTVSLNLPESYALAYSVWITERNNQYRSEDHRMLDVQISGQIHKELIV